VDTPLRIAFACSRMTSDFSRTIWYSLQEAATDLGVHLTAVTGGTLDHPRLPIPARRVYDLLDGRNFDGVLLQTPALGYYSTPAALSRFLAELRPLPVVSLGVVVEGVSSVALDQGVAIQAMVRHLYDHHGHRRFAFVAGPLDQVEAEERRVGFVAVMEELGVGPQQITLFPGEFDRASGAAAVRALATRAAFPLALVCSNDEEALGALEEAKLLGLSVPSQLAISGFDDIELAALQDPSLTSVIQPHIRQAGRALALLVQQIRGDKTVVHEIEAAPLSFRESCGCLPPSVLRPTDKASLLIDLMATQNNATDSFLAFLRQWISDYLTAFEYLVETGNPAVLRGQWARYFARITAGQERGLSFRSLFAGLERLYGERPTYKKALEENLLLAGAAESQRGTRVDQKTRHLFFVLHAVEHLIGQINDRAGLAALSFSSLSPLGVLGLALVRFGAPPSMVYFHGRSPEVAALESWGPIDYPALLAADVEAAAPPASRIVISLIAEKAYLGYAVFWTESRETFICEFLANQFSGALHRIELLERIREQSQTLEASLEETKRMQQQLVETEKVASLGRLVAGVAHEINTPLGTGITGTSFLLERLAEVQGQFSGGVLPRSGLELFFSQGREALEGVLRNLMKAGELIQAFKGLGLDHGQGEWKPIQLNTLFGDLGSVYAGEFSKRGIELRLELPSETSLVYSQPSALVQVAGELLENALDHAFPVGFVGSPQVLLQVEVQEGILRLAVTDNGRGLGAEERRHLFDPLYTTGRAEGHAGLGLHLAFQLISRTLGGQMTVASQGGAGSCFLCVIPLKTP